MEIKEALSKREKLEGDIVELIEKFMKETGLWVDSVGLSYRHDVKDGHVYAKETMVEVHVKL